jgi:sterol O-acyltransferase
LLETKLSELSHLEAAEETNALATGFELQEQRHLRLTLTESNLTNPDPKNENSRIGSIISAIDRGVELDEDAIEDFTDALRNELKALNVELHGKTTDPAKQYPNNLTLHNWLDYTLLPTLVYELEYPRQDRINWWYVAEKTTATLGIIWVMIMVSQAHIYPLVQRTVAMKAAGAPLADRWRELPWVAADLLFPMLLEQLLAWYVIWECVLNVLAELTGFADRSFYGKWWNSVSWDQYARDWNRPVHDFLLRHVYNSSISAFHLSKGAATFFTFLLSACVHELLMLCIFKKVRGYLFAMQLMQLPLVSLSRTKPLKGREVLGNLIFWFGLFVGPSILASLYLIV